MWNRSLVFAALVVLAAACGGGDDASTDTTPAVTDAEPALETDTTTETQSEDEPAETTMAEADSDEGTPAATAEGSATITVGDMTWEFAMTGEDSRELCDPDFPGGFRVFMFGEDETGQEVFLIVQAPAAGGDAIVEAGMGAVEEWMADSSVYDQYGMVEGLVIPEGIAATAQVSGNSVSGEGTFYEEIAMQGARASGVYEAGVLDGTFQATCPAS